MAFDFNSLLQSLFNEDDPSMIVPETKDPNEIVVERSNDRPQGVAPQDLVPRSLDNRAFIEERDQALKNGQDTTVHKGMFGTKGVLRDVLGILGDAFLVQSGNKSVYDVQRNKERVGDAMAGYTQDYQGAAERMTGLDPELSAEVQKMGMQDELKRAQLESLAASRKSLIDDRNYGNMNDASNKIARLFASPEGQKNPEAAYQYAQRIAKAYGTTLEALGLDPSMTEDERGMFAATDMTVNQIKNLPIAQQNADTRRISATRPRAASRPSNPTNASMAAPILDKVRRGEAITPGEQEFLDRAGYEVPKRGRQRPSQSGNTTAPTSRFRRLN